METLQEHIAVGMGIAYHAKKVPHNKAIISEFGERTFSELNANCNKFANYLLEKGLQPGDAIAIVCKNRPEFLEALFGPLRIGLRITPINWHLTPEEICYIVENCEARVVVCDAEFSDFLTAIHDAMPEINLMCVDGENPVADSFLETISTFDNSDIAEPVAGRSMLYTSGTTGRPKGVFRKENPPPSKTEQLTLDTAAFDPNSDFSICPGPAYHAAPLGLNINISLMAGVGVYLMDKWDAEKMLSLIDEHKCTHTHMVATMFHRILRLPEETKSRYDLSSMRWILHGAAPCPVEVKQGMMDWMGPILYEYYAATEGGGCFIEPKEWLEKPGSVGKANEGTEVKILDDNFKEVATSSAAYALRDSYDAAVIAAMFSGVSTSSPDHVLGADASAATQTMGQHQGGSNELSFKDRNSEEGVYTITAAGGDRLVLPIEIVGKKADIQDS